ncbi:MAG: YraN family protein [Anaerolineae bacterium]
MSQDPRKSLGARGEQLAAQHLEAQGFTILDRNWRCAAGELDIIAWEGETLAFVEVRTRRGSAGPTPEQSITPAKQAKLIQLAQTYLQEHHLTDAQWRIDFVAVEMDGRGVLRRVELIRNAVTGW